MFVNRPATVLLVGFSILILLSSITIYLDYFKLDLTSPYDFHIKSDQIVIESYMYEVAKDHLSKQNNN